MEVKNLRIHQNMPFEDYLNLEGTSYSTIRGAGVGIISVTKKMELGKQVHAYLLTPKEYNYENHDLVFPIASALQKQLGSLVKYMQPELSFQADFCSNGFVMPYKGRADIPILFAGKYKIVIDIKVSEMPLKKAIEYFRYDYQVSGYCIGLNAEAGMIISIHPKTKLITMANIPIDDQFWDYNVRQKGVAI